MKKSFIQRGSLILSDSLSLCVSLVLAVYILNILRPGSQEYIDLNRLGLAKLFGFFILAVFWQQEHYTKRRPSWEEIKLLYLTIFIFAVIHFCVTFLLAHHIVKLVNAVFWFLLLIIIPLFRLLTKNILAKLNFWQRDIYLVGCGENAIATYNLLTQHKILGYQVIGFISLDDYTVDNNKLLENIPILSYNTLLNHDPNKEIEVIFALEQQELTKNAYCVDIIQTRFTFVSVVPDISGLPLYGASLDHFFGSNQVILRLKNNLSRRINRIIKRSSDIILAVIGVIMLAPFFIMFAILIRLLGTRVFFYHKRIGRNGDYFYCIKFQTMYQNSQDILERVLATDENAKAEWEKDFKLKNDPRVTPIGKFLRKTSLDEIPQLFNVLRGEMSLVG
ncbi:MAG: sugar transferase, partial [Burkholderiales bacterium]|nr:sugar transferase [Burkholderiales bacterium]